MACRTLAIGLTSGQTTDNMNSMLHFLKFGISKVKISMQKDRPVLCRPCIISYGEETTALHSSLPPPFTVIKNWSPQ